jgi:putative flippase GtrA
MVSSRFVRFCIVGTVGFLADSSILYAMLSLGSGPIAARLLSFLCAVFITWQLNRRMTFTASAQQDLIREGLSYLLAMSLGGALNLMTYVGVIRALPTHVWAPGAGVAAGSVVGLLVNYITARHWVFTAKTASWGLGQWTRREQTGLILVALQLVFWLGALHVVDLPGLYMDAVNPDYLAARTLHPEIGNSVNAMPTAWVPLLGSLYHGVQNYYVTLPVVGLLGFNLPALRIAQALFGAGIVTMTYFVAQRVLLSRLLAFAGAGLLATDIAFLASFRTQFYIVLSGVFWLLSAVYVALGPKRDERSDQRVWISGALYGLAVYSYFIFLFILPVWFVLVRYNTGRWRTTVHWGLGFCLGMSPYVLGYLSLLVALGGPHQMVDWIVQNLTGLSPLASKLTFAESVLNSLRNASYALQNTGNELMIFGSALGTRLTEFKAWWLVLGSALLFVPAHILLGRSQATTHSPIKADGPLILPHQLGWFPLAFMLFSLTLGNRIWIHHFSILVPLLYLLAISGFSRVFVGRWKSWMVVMVLAIGVLNLHQQDRFFDQLEATGGVGKMSNAQARLVEDALAAPAQTVYLFPEWGFFMPFAFLTGNHKPYELDVSVETLHKHQRLGNVVRVAFWSANDEAKYTALLKAQGFKIQEVLRYMQRDQQPAFFVIHATP